LGGVDAGIPHLSLDAVADPPYAMNCVVVAKIRGINVAYAFAWVASRGRTVSGQVIVGEVRIDRAPVNFRHRAWRRRRPGQSCGGDDGAPSDRTRVAKISWRIPLRPIMIWGVDLASGGQRASHDSLNVGHQI
jgi:hypothetical protein